VNALPIFRLDNLQLLLLIAAAEREALQAGHSLEEACLAWTPNGLEVTVRGSKAESLMKLLRMTSSSEQFTSFTRKLYRWGFRQVTNDNLPFTCGRNDKVFWHSDFQRDDKPRTMMMKSVTTYTRKTLSSKVMAESNAKHRSQASASNDALMHSGLIHNQDRANSSNQLAYLNQTNHHQAVSTTASSLQELADWQTAIMQLTTPDPNSMARQILPASGTTPSGFVAARFARLTNQDILMDRYFNRDVQELDTAMLQLIRSSQASFVSTNSDRGLSNVGISGQRTALSEAATLWELRQQATRQFSFRVPSKTLLPSTKSEDNQTTTNPSSKSCTRNHDDI
jgi:hypothetical protein